jgi:hypothetical protein
MEIMFTKNNVHAQAAKALSQINVVVFLKCVSLLFEKHHRLLNDLQTGCPLSIKSLKPSGLVRRLVCGN